MAPSPPISNAPGDRFVSLDVRCANCDQLLLRLECDPDTNALGVLACPYCGNEEMFDVVDMMADRCIMEDG